MEIPDKKDSSGSGLEPRGPSCSCPEKTRTDSSKTIRTVQALRAIAALLVVLEHCHYLWYVRKLHEPQAIRWMNGAAGVDIFFVISGFVMTTSLGGLAKYKHPIRVFLHRRITRIVPLYWLATTAKIVLLLVAPWYASETRLDLATVFGSYLFLPVVPVIVVGWTLNYEMFFYYTFCFAMAFKKRFYWILSPLLIVLAGLGLFSRPTWPPITAFVSPMLMEFYFGVLIAQFALSKRLPGKVACWIFLTAGLLAILTVCPHLLASEICRRFRFLVWGVPAAAIVIGSVGLEERIGHRIPEWLISQGNASYAIYLMQVFALQLVGIVLVRLPVDGLPARAFCIASGLILSALAGEFVHRLIEKPLLKFLKNKQQRGAGVLV